MGTLGQGGVPPRWIRIDRTPRNRDPEAGWQEERVKTKEFVKLHGATIQRVAQELLQRCVLYMNELLLLVQTPDLTLAAWFKEGELAARKKVLSQTKE